MKKPEYMQIFLISENNEMDNQFWIGNSASYFLGFRFPN
jgi:hypothetical protein